MGGALFWDRMGGIGAPVSVTGAPPPLHPLTWIAHLLPEARQATFVAMAAAVMTALLIHLFVRRRGLGVWHASIAAITAGFVLVLQPGVALLGLGVASAIVVVDWFGAHPSRGRWAALVAVVAIALLGAGGSELAAVLIAAAVAPMAAPRESGASDRSAVVPGVIAAGVVAALLAAPGYLPAWAILLEELPVLAQYRSHWPLTLFAAVPLVLIVRPATSARVLRLSGLGACALLFFGMIATLEGPIVLSTIAVALSAARMAGFAPIVFATAGIAGTLLLSTVVAVEEPCALRTETRDGGTVRVIDPSAPSLHCTSSRVEALLHRARTGGRWLLDSPALDAAGVAFVGAVASADVLPAVRLAERFRLTRGGPPEAEPLDRRSALVDHIPPKIERLAFPLFDTAAPRWEMTGAGGTLEVIEHGNGITRVRIRSRGWNLLVTSEPAWSGWRAHWNGDRLSPVVVNQAFVGSFVPPGDGVLVLRYRPEAFDFGLRVAAGGLLLGLFTLFVPWYRHVPAFPRVAPRWLPAKLRVPRPRLSARSYSTIGIALLLAYAAVLSVYFADVASGADQSGYLNFSRLLARGDLSVPLQFPLESGLPPELVPAFVPLGFVPGTEPYTIVPSYPPGFPIMIAAVRAVAGDAAAFRIPAFLAAAGVLLMYFLGRSFELSRGWSAAGAAMLAVFPTYVFMAVQAMTDSMAAALAVGAILCALRSRNGAWWAIGAGALMGIGVMVRPTQMLLFPAVLLALQLRPRALLALGAGGLPFAVAQMMISNHLYGSPFSTGYGSIGYLLSLDGSLVRFRHYSYWLAVLATPLIYPGGLAVLFSRVIDWWTRGVLAFWFACFFLFYIVYAPYETWWYTRFLLPALPALIIGTLFGLRAVARYAAPGWRFAAPLLAACVIGAGLLHTIDRRVLTFAEHERLYVRAISGSERHVGPEAMLVAMQFSGALRYYSGRSIVRWDQLDPATFELVRRAAGSRPWFALLSNYEIEDAFRAIPGKWVEVERYGHVVLFKRAAPPF